MCSNPFHMRQNSTFHHARQRAALLAVCSLLLSGVVSAARTNADVSGPATIHIENFGRVDAKLYRGAQPSGQDFADLKNLGVKTVVDLTSGDGDPRERIAAEAAGLRYVAIPMTTHVVPTAAQMSEFLGLFRDADSQPVFVHCVGGRHRTGVMTAVYRITNMGWNGEQAFREMKQYHFGADALHREFKQFVYGFQPLIAPPSAVLVKTAATESASASVSGSVE
jgi:protein tyrosine/serine phosphatase